jgi:hypothetical protein
MPNGRSRAKGLRGEHDITKRLGGKRVGVAYLRNPVDVETDFAVYQVRNRPMGATAIYDALKAMENVAPHHNKYVLIKPKRGVWICCELLSQHQNDHGEFPKERLES